MIDNVAQAAILEDAVCTSSGLCMSSHLWRKENSDWRIVRNNVDFPSTLLLLIREESQR